MVCFFENYYLYSDMPNSQVELIYSYLIGFPEPPVEGLRGGDWESSLRLKKLSLKGTR